MTEAVPPPLPIIDVFAGPGGLNEGFSSLDQGTTFRTAASIEMDPIACGTLRLRATVRRIRDSAVDMQHYRDALRSGDIRSFTTASESIAEAWSAAGAEVHELELGSDTRDTSDSIISAALSESLGDRRDRRWVLVGGPPCQAYSLVGRARRRGDSTFKDDKKHTLYREYLHIVDEHKPTVFVMENVKGLLSAKYDDTSMYGRIIDDLEASGEYEIRSFVSADPARSGRDHVIRAEMYGVPQRRHRVILFGVRRDAGLGAHDLLPRVEHEVTVRDVLAHLPRIRSKVSRTDSVEGWRLAREIGLRLARKANTTAGPVSTGGAYVRRSLRGVPEPDSLEAWLTAAGLDGFPQHESRSHMPSDISRYAFLAASARNMSILDLPHDLRTDHQNVSGAATPFQDRFHVQTWDRPSSTVVSHLSKDGNHFIHPDPRQARSLTVREAARLQTFPDDYYFMGSRTQQFQQVGNAVPPWLAKQLAASVAALLQITEQEAAA